MAGIETFETTGTIKWYESGRGFGFIKPDNLDSDVFFHVSVLRASGHERACTGARVHVQGMHRPRGLMATRIVNMDESSAELVKDGVPRMHVIPRVESDWDRAQVLWFNRVRGFGFLDIGDGGGDVFVHMETLRHFSFADLRSDQVVQIRWGRGDKGRVAAALRPDRLHRQERPHA